jgi:hypothetical protein
MGSLAAVIFWPSGSTRDFESATAETSDLRFTDMSMAAYDGLLFQFTQNKPNDRSVSTRGHSSKDGDVIISGNITNVTNSELYLIDAFPPESFKSGDPPFLRLLVDGQPHDYVAAILVSGSMFAQGGGNDEFAGYYIKPDEKLGFKLMVADLKIGLEDELDFGFEWNTFDPATFETRIMRPEFHFTRNGSSFIWNYSKFKWKRSALIIRTK